ncbi:hypothetical protein ACWD0A_03135 [Streptomyces sp. NPDC002867]
MGKLLGAALAAAALAGAPALAYAVGAPPAVVPGTAVGVVGLHHGAEGIPPDAPHARRDGNVTAQRTVICRADATTFPS